MKLGGLRKLMLGLAVGGALLSSGFLFAACNSRHTHDLVLVKGVEATCTQAGTKRYYECKTCRQKFDDVNGKKVIKDKDLETWKVIEPQGHKCNSWSYYPAEMPTCTVAGHQAYYACVRCEAKFRDAACQQQFGESEVILPAIGHMVTLDSYYLGQEPTCTEGGRRSYYLCEHEGCQAKFADTQCQIELREGAFPENDPNVPASERDLYLDLPALGHQAGPHVAGVEATCNKSGSKPYYNCLHCLKKFSDSNCTQPIESTYIEKSAHVWSETKRTNLKNAANREVPETYYKTCQFCDAYNPDETFTVGTPLVYGAVTAVKGNLTVDLRTNTDTVSFVANDVLDSDGYVRAMVTAPEGLQTLGAVWVDGPDGVKTAFNNFPTFDAATRSIILTLPINSEDILRGKCEARWQIVWVNYHAQDVVLKVVIS